MTLVSKNTRAGKLYHKGLEAFESDSLKEISDVGAGMLRAMAVMIAEATKPKQRASNGRTLKHMESGLFAYELLKKKAPEALVYEPVARHTFSRLGKILDDANITDAQFTILIDWLKAGGLSWMHSPPTWGQFVTKCIDWIARAQHEAQSQIELPLSDLDRLREDGQL
jgi:hypothetical protein